MNAMKQRLVQPTAAGSPSPSPSAPKLSGDERFVPASHGLITDRHVSHPAFRLWCVLHRLWFLHEPPAMDLLQDLMGTPVAAQHAVDANGSRDTDWQPATRRSIERWLTELERAGWLLWVRRAETTRRYHLRTSARSATDTAMLTTLRTLLNSGKATMSDIQQLLDTASSVAAAATATSHDSIRRSQQDAVTGSISRGNATPGSQNGSTADSAPSHTSHDTIMSSQSTIPATYAATQGSRDVSAESHHALSESYAPRPPGALVRQSSAPYSEIPQHESYHDSTPPTAATASSGDDSGPTIVERYLLQQGFSTRAAHEFRDFDLSVVQSDLERRRNFGQGIGAMVATWRVEPPHAALPDHDEAVTLACQTTGAKAQAITIAPADASPLEIQYLALDLEEGVPSETALALLRARRTDALVGGMV